MSHRHWTPLFEATESEPFWNAIDAVMAELDSADVQPLDWGKPLLHAYLAVARSSPAHRARAEALLTQAAEIMETEALRPALYYGIAGVGWITAHALRVLDCHDESLFDAVDEGLLTLVRQPRRRQMDYDLIGGYVGLGVYFLERLPAAKAREGLTHILRLLDATAEFPDEDSATWHTAPELLPPWQREIAPTGYYNAGVAHGVPGIVGLLASMQHAGVLQSDGQLLLSRAARWVLRQLTPDGRLPHWVGHMVGDGRLSWCYGELGAALVLVHAGSALNDHHLCASALNVARMAGTRPETTLHTPDACLCHGAAGNAHLFNRLFQATGITEFATYARQWYDRALAMREPGTGIGGFLMWQPDPRNPQNRSWKHDASFLAGVSGAALSLLAAVTPVEPRWDRAILTAITGVDEQCRPQT